MMQSVSEILANDTLKTIPKDELPNYIIDMVNNDPAGFLKHAKEIMEFIPEEDRYEYIRSAAFMPDVPGLTHSISRSADYALPGIQSYIEFIPQEERVAFIEEQVRTKAPLEKAVSSIDSYAPYVSKDELNQMLAGALERELGGRKPEIAYVAAMVACDDYSALTQWIEQNDKAAGFVNEINELHDSPSHIRFKCVENMSASETLNLIVSGGAYTSTSIGLIERFEQKMNAEGKNSIFDAASPVCAEAQVLSLLEVASTRGQIDKMLNFVQPKDWDPILRMVTDEIEKGEPGAIALLSDIAAHADDATQELIKKRLISEYNHAQSQEIKDHYGVALAQYNAISGKDPVAFENSARYMLPSTDVLAKDQLTGSDGVVRELMIFPTAADTDAKASFSNFLNTYKNKPGYTVTQGEDFVTIKSTSGTPIEIYANKPGHDPERIFEKLGTTPHEAEFDVIVNRGHSYHIDDTLKYVSDKASLVVLGSCGGYDAQIQALEKAPDAQIISTKETGSMYVNDPLLLHIHESIRQTGGVNWETEQKYLDGLKNENKTAYVLPHKNLLTSVISNLGQLELDRYENNLSSAPEAYRQGVNGPYTTQVSAISVAPAGSVRSLDDNNLISAHFNTTGGIRPDDPGVVVSDARMGNVYAPNNPVSSPSPVAPPSVNDTLYRMSA